ncbi:ribonuclease H-like domain-containing protein [Tanacetum coccineum]
MWSIAMTFALRNHNKLGFIDGSCKKDSSNPSLANQWDMCSSVVVTWILNSLSSELFADAIYAKTDSERLMISGEESHRNVTSVGTTKPVATAFVAKTFDNKKRFNNNFKGSGSNSNSNNKGPNPNLKCTNCNKISHTVDKCFELVGYPAGYVKRNFNSNSRHVTSNNASADVHSNGDIKLFVGFDENNCYIQDLKANRTAEIGKQYNGLYLFDVDNACKIVSNNCIASSFVSKTFWHQRLSHSADQVLDVELSQNFLLIVVVYNSVILCDIVTQS